MVSVSQPCPLVLVLAIIGVDHLEGPGKHRLGIGVRYTENRERVPNTEILCDRRPAPVPLVIDQVPHPSPVIRVRNRELVDQLLLVLVFRIPLTIIQ